jgi:hypothetical protein
VPFALPSRGIIENVVIVKLCAGWKIKSDM